MSAEGRAVRRAVVACVLAATGAAGGAQQAGDPGAVIERVIDAYAVAAPYVQVQRTYHLEIDRGRGLETLSPGEVPALLGEAIFTVEVTVDPGRGVLLDRTHPAVRAVRGRQAVSVYAGGMVHEVTAGSSRARRWEGTGRSVSSAPREYVLSALAQSLAHLAEMDEGETLEYDADGSLLLRFTIDKRTYRIDPTDYTVLGMRSEGDPNAPFTDVYLGLVPTPVMKARMPTYRVRRVEWARGTGRPWFQAVTVYEEPRVGARAPAEEFRWQTYADRAIRVSDGTIYDRDERVIGVEPPEEGERARRRARARAVTVDPASLERYLDDPSRPPRLQRGWGPSGWLAALGVACLALAGAWSIRRRLG